MGFFLSSMAYLEGSSPKEKLKKAYVPGMTNNFLLWPWVQAANFKYVPLEHRVLVVNFVALGTFDAVFSCLGGSRGREGRQEKASYYNLDCY
jgi:protein Mpv17